MIDLHQHMQDTISRLDAIIDGWTLGRLIIEDDHAFLAIEIGEIILLDRRQFEIEVRNGDKFVPVTVQQVLNSISTDGWNLYAGLDCRIRQRRVA
ncbi:hypothetical protein [Sporolactobacillus terrae]|uniref:hypothetical protein n=1 Tax=Sporolactobacillus terrae TaxID=269673 RepID=UPI00111B9690|nr:hypothetical protein [Sporolactobacillus terrae]